MEVGFLNSVTVVVIIFGENVLKLGNQIEILALCVLGNKQRIW